MSKSQKTTGAKPAKRISKNIVIIDGVEYIKGKTAIKIRNRFYPIQDTEIDTYTNERELRSKLTAWSINKSKGYTSNAKLVCIKNTNHMRDLDSMTFNEVMDAYYKSGTFVAACSSILDKNPEYFVKHLFIENLYVLRDHKFIYNDRQFKTQINKYYNLKEYGFPITSMPTKINSLSNIPYTFGLEIETGAGVVDIHEIHKLGCAVLYDGSISNVEVVTLPCTFNNLDHINNIFTRLSSSMAIDTSCALHIHIGNVPFSEDNLLSLYILYQRLTIELNQLIVPYRKQPKFIAQKNRDHCDDLPKLLQKDAIAIYRLLQINNIVKEGAGSQYLNNRKWTQNGRYYNINFLNYILAKDHNKTIEIRHHQSTLSFDMMMTWLLLNVAIIDYAIKNTKKVIVEKVKIEIEDIINDVQYPLPIKNTLNRNIDVLRNNYYDSRNYKNDYMQNIESVDTILSRKLMKYEY